MFTFQDRLGLQLSITPKGGRAMVIAGGDIKDFSLQLTSYGWSGTIEFHRFDDAANGERDPEDLFTNFMSSKLLQIELAVSAQLNDTLPAGQQTRPPVKLKGIVTKRAVVELAYRELAYQSQTPVRRYRLECGDAARVLWGQHHPCRLYADSTMQQLFSEHAGQVIRLRYDWNKELSKQYPLLFLGLDPSIGDASFYDFFIWWIDRHRGILSYDVKTDEYWLRAGKKDGTKTFSVYRQDVMQVQLVCPEIPRYAPQVFDSFTGAEIGPKAISNTFAVSGITRDTLLRTPLKSEFDDRVDLETQRLTTAPPTELCVDFKRLPAEPLFPGDKCEFKTPSLKWPADAWFVKHGGFRVFEVSLSGSAVNQAPSADHEADSNVYRMSYQARLELESDKTSVRLPAFREPTYPVRVEGTIVSTLGSADEETYEPVTLQGGLTGYRVHVPLWDKKIPAPYNPGRLPGQLYFPAYKNERVLLALTWHKAWIESFLDWRNGVKPADARQANHLLLGKNTKSSTSIESYYDDPDKPIFRIVRTHQSDLQTICISEGTLLIEVKEGDSPVKDGHVDPNLQD